MDADDELDARAKELGERWERALAGEPEEVGRAFAFLAAMAMIKVGKYTRVYRGERNGRRVLIATEPYSERVFEILDPEYGEGEDAAVAAMLRVLGLG